MKKLIILSLLFAGCAKSPQSSSVMVVLKGKVQQLNITKKSISHIHNYFDITSEIKDTILTVYSVGKYAERIKISKNVRVSPIAYIETEWELPYNKNIDITPNKLNGESHELNKSCVKFYNFEAN